jgi:hypothetical protein
MHFDHLFQQPSTDELIDGLANLSKLNRDESASTDCIAGRNDQAILRFAQFSITKNLN